MDWLQKLWGSKDGGGVKWGKVSRLVLVRVLLK